MSKINSDIKHAKPMNKDTGWDSNEIEIKTVNKDTDQTALLRAIWVGSTLFAHAVFWISMVNRVSRILSEFDCLQ